MGTTSRKVSKEAKAHEGSRRGSHTVIQDTTEEIDDDTRKQMIEAFAANATARIIEAGKSTRWQKGVSANPFSKPAPAIPDDASLDETLAIILGKDGAIKLARKLIDLANKGDKQAIMYIYDRLEGKPTQKVVTEKMDDNPLVVILQRIAGDSNRNQLPSPSIIQLDSPIEEGI